MSLQPLPIDDVLPEVVEALRVGNAAVLRAPTGAGKTTRIPPALLDAGISAGKLIIVLQPRRVAARAAATRMAAERGSPVGTEIGYQFRFERNAGPRTRILCVTDGILIRMLQDDPLLESVGALVFDEFHERSLNSDLALAMVRRVQTEVRPDLKLLVMSATLDIGPIAKFLGGCPTFQSQGRSYPIEVRYSSFAVTRLEPGMIVNAIGELLQETDGDLLVFLPGMAEIRRVQTALQDTATRQSRVILLMHGDLPLEQQHTVLAANAPPKIVLATNIAETSVTIPGITAVIDSGQARILHYDSSIGLNRLTTQRISRASADQRAGRAGRTAPGICLRLWTEREQDGLSEYDDPEISRVDLSEPVLQLLCWGEKVLLDFPWYESPPAAALEQAATLLNDLGAMDSRGLTPIGREMASLPLHPRIARVILAGKQLGCVAETTLAAAMLGERSPFRLDHGRQPGPAAGSDCDVLDRVHSLMAYERSGQREFDCGLLHIPSARNILRVRDQLLRLVSSGPQQSPSKQPGSTDINFRRALLAGFADRVARRRNHDRARALMVGGRGVRIHEQVAVKDADLIVCVEIGGGSTGEGVVRQASAIELKWLSPQQLETSIETEYDTVRERVVAYHRTRYRGLVVNEAVTSVPNDEDGADVLAAVALERLDFMGILDAESKTFMARVEFLRKSMPELDLPELGVVHLKALLPRWCDGCRSLDDLRKKSPLHLLKASLTAQQFSIIEREAPERLTVPSGNRIPLQYDAGNRPVLAVRIQEVFGMNRTPRIAAGRVAVLMHLLAPNMRPQQITDDLESFWRTTYAQVRKDLRRRYPKHAWPENPADGVAVARSGGKRPN